MSLVTIRTRSARAAAYSYKLATGQAASHPINLHLQDAADRIREATDGRLEIRIFPNNRLGSDTDLIGQVRSGGVELLNISASVLSTLVPACGLVNVGFAFPDYPSVWKAMDGPLGAYLREQIGRAGLAMAARFADNGFRQITSRRKVVRGPEDLRGFTIRVPLAPLFTSLFRALGATPVALNFNEVLAAIRTDRVDGQENGLVVVDSARLYEVQTHVAETNHVWDAYCLLANRSARDALPQDVQDILARELDRAVMAERADVEKLSASLKEALQLKGMEFHPVDRKAFRDMLGRSAYYGDARAQLGDPAWNTLQSAVGGLG